MSKFTPGAWRVQKYRNGQKLMIQTEKGFMGETICIMNENKYLAEARLIAAAPELVEALKVVNKWLIENIKAPDRPAKLDKIIMDVLAKVEGKE